MLKKIKFKILRLWYLLFKNHKTVKFNFGGEEIPFGLGEYVLLEVDGPIFYHLGSNTFLMTEHKLKENGDN